MSTFLAIITNAVFVMVGMVIASALLVKIAVWLDEQAPEERGS